MSRSGARHLAVAARVTAALAIGLGGSTASVLEARAIGSDTPVKTYTIPPNGSLTYISGYSLVAKVLVPQYATIQNPNNSPETVRLGTPSTGRRLAELGVAGGGLVLSIGGAAGIMSLGRRKRSRNTLAD